MDKLNATTYKEEVKTDPKDRIEVEVGDSKQSDFKPQVKIMRWNNEVNFSMRAEEKEDSEVVEENGKIKYKTPDYEVHQYSKPDASESGGFEFEWVLPKKPDGNVLTATIQTKGLNFYYQPPLTQEEIDGGTSRPDNVVGSYAVYHATKGGINDAQGMDYKVGKAFHIYRPKAIDNDNNEIWCDLNIDEQAGILSVTINQDWLNKAAYPVIVDPTLGYTSQGGTQGSLANTLVGSYATLSDYMLATSMTWYGRVGGAGSDEVKMAIYVGTTLALIGGSNIKFDDDTNAQVVGWQTETMVINKSAPPARYLMVGWGSSAASNQIYFDVGSSGDSRSQSITYATSFPDPMGGSNGSNLYSVYVTYDYYTPVSKSLYLKQGFS